MNSSLPSFVSVPSNPSPAVSGRAVLPGDASAVPTGNASGTPAGERGASDAAGWSATFSQWLGAIVGVTPKDPTVVAPAGSEAADLETSVELVDMVDGLIDGEGVATPTTVATPPPLPLSPRRFSLRDLLGGAGHEVVTDEATLPDVSNLTNEVATDSPVEPRPIPARAKQPDQANPVDGGVTTTAVSAPTVATSSPPLVTANDDVEPADDAESDDRAATDDLAADAGEMPVVGAKAAVVSIVSSEIVASAAAANVHTPALASSAATPSATSDEPISRRAAAKPSVVASSALSDRPVRQESPRGSFAPRTESVPLRAAAAPVSSGPRTPDAKPSNAVVDGAVTARTGTEASVAMPDRDTTATNQVPETRPVAEMPSTERAGVTPVAERAMTAKPAIPTPVAVAVANETASAAATTDTVPTDASEAWVGFSASREVSDGAARRSASLPSNDRAIARSRVVDGGLSEPSAQFAAPRLPTGQDSLNSDSRGGKNWLQSPDKQKVNISSEDVGINQAKPAEIMPALPSQPSAPAASVAAPAAPQVARADVTRLIERVEEVAHQVASLGEKQVDLKIDLAAGQQVSVRVSMHGGQVHTSFRTETPELRDALAGAWHTFTRQADASTVSWAEPNFASTVAAGFGGNATGGDSGSHSQPQSPSQSGSFSGNLAQDSQGKGAGDQTPREGAADARHAFRATGKSWTPATPAGESAVTTARSLSDSSQRLRVFA